jgi:ankyrin repeat protein
MIKKTTAFTKIFLILSTALFAEIIHDAVKKGDIEKVKSILSKDPQQLNVLDNFKYTPLDWAATLAKWEMVKLLIDKGVKVGNIGWDGGTVLHRACHYDNTDIIKLLIDKGVDFRVQNQWGRTALHAAARRNCLKVAAFLIDQGADPNVTTKEGWTPLHVAAKSGHKEMMELLMGKGSLKDFKDKEGKTYLQHIFQRPAEIPMKPNEFDEYLGQYSKDSGFTVVVWKKDNRIYITDFGFDEMYPIAKDEFFCRHEPWKVTFYRNDKGDISEMDLAFLRQTHRLKKESDT